MSKKIKCYAVKHKNSDIVSKSRSGGMFTAISDYVLSHNGVVYGCILDDNFNAIHVRATFSSSRGLMRGSKYVQSDLGNCFSNIKEDLENGTYVLFSGTSCQVAGLKAFLIKQYTNLFCVDVVCHGFQVQKFGENI